MNVEMSQVTTQGAQRPYPRSHPHLRGISVSPFVAGTHRGKGGSWASEKHQPGASSEAKACGARPSHLNFTLGLQTASLWASAVPLPPTHNQGKPQEVSDPGPENLPLELPF